ncbi:MAG: beta-glucosidase [Dehalococcoidia bacterium]|nr:beta-glucosidase [Dehalococcoidia bacterium]
MTMLEFPQGFQWGAATASYQIEGAHNEDDRGLSIWDTFSHQPGRVMHGENGDIACDHYHRYEQDIALMAELGLQTYRFSVSWSRVIPFGTGHVNEKGLAFYDRLIDALLDRGIEPALTLYHWDLPQALQDLGGWANREIVEAFAGYARLLFERYGDRVSRWITLNEPLIFTQFGHRSGVMAPGIRSLPVTARAVHHALLAHGRAVQAFRESGREGEIGITNANTSYEPADDTPETLRATELARDFDTRLYHGPVYGRGYPESVLAYYAARDAALPILPGDLEVIAAPTDFLGVNLYSRQRIEASDDRGVGYRNAPPTLPLLDMGYEAAPHALGDFVRWVTKEYGRPRIYITENGVCDNTELAGGRVDDQLRIDLLRGFLAGLHGAIADGADVRAYYQWSLMDNFEWAFGYSKRFGMVWTDFATQERVKKASAEWYAGVIRRNGVEG